jgi:beta-glucosidase
VRRHGLSYTTFELSDLTISEPVVVVASNDLSLTISVRVRNTGPVAGAEVVQVYITPPGAGASPTALRGFAKTRALAPGADAVALDIKFDRCAVGAWDAEAQRWRGRRGTYGVRAGRSSAELPLAGTFKLERDIEWTGV